VALERYHAEGMEVAWARFARFAAAVRAALESLGFTLVSRPDAHSPTVVAAYAPDGVDVAALLKMLREKHRVVFSGGQGELSGKILRFGTMGDVRDVDFLGAIGAIELTLLDLGQRLSPGTATAAAIESLSGRVTSGVA
jgi:aspartate aminotransferase-like enzyme